LSDPIAPANGPDAASDPVAGFKNGNSVSRSPKLKGRYEAGDSRSKNYDGAAVAASIWQGEMFGIGGRWNGKAQCFHGHVGCANTADGGDLLQQCAAGYRHDQPIAIRSG
jgi:hypothetical protein